MNKLPAGIPIIYIHRGYCPYLRLSLLQAKQSNPAARLILLGDEENKRIAAETGAEFFPFAGYFSLADEFEKVYKHHSSNGYPYEVFCFQRWFVLKAFAATENLTGYFLYNDSDTYLFTDVNALIKGFVARYDLSICGPIAPCFVFFKNRQVLEEFCHFITQQYTVDENYLFLVEMHERRQAENIGELHVMFETVSDMTMLGLFNRKHRSRIVDLSDYEAVRQGIFEENHYLGFHREFRGRFPLGRKVKWRNRQPHYVGYDGRLVPVLGFHFQGHAKREMFRLFRGNKKKVPPKERWLHARKYWRFVLATCKKRLKKRLKGR